MFHQSDLFVGGGCAVDLGRLNECAEARPYLQQPSKQRRLVGSGSQMLNNQIGLD